MGKREVVAFNKVIGAGVTEILSERLKNAGFVERVTVRFYAGSERTLKVRPYVLHTSEKNENLFTYPEGTNPWLSGEDDTFRYDVSIPIDTDDEIKVWVSNEGLYAYDLVCFIEVSYNYEGVSS